MKYTTTIVIALEREKVLEIIMDLDQKKHWLRGLQDYKILDGRAGQEGSVVLLKFIHNTKYIEMTETLTKNNLPDGFQATYTTKGVHNLQHNHFIETDGETKWVCETEFNFSSWIMKALALFSPKSFKGRTEKYFKDFKNYAEQGISVAESH